MNTLRQSTKATLVKILVAIPLLVLFAGLKANAVTVDSDSKKKSDDESRPKDGLSACYYLTDKDDKKDCLSRYSSDKGDSCTVKRKEALEASKEIKKACGDAGMSGEECYSQAKRCSEVSRESATDNDNSKFSIFNSLASAYGVDTSSMNANKKKNQNGCPQYSGEDYRKRLKEINDELKDVKKDITDLKKESTDLEKDTQKDMQDTQKDIQEAQKDMQKDLHDIDDDTRKQMNDLTKDQSSLRQQLDENDQKIVDLRGQMAQSEADKAEQMIAMNDAMIKDACVAKYETELYNTQQQKLNRSVSFAQMKQTKQKLRNIYNSCIMGYQAKRVSIITGTDSKQSTIKSKIISAQSAMEETQHGIDLAQSQTNEIQTSATTKKNEAQQGLAQKMQTAQTSLQTSQTNMQKQQQNFQSRYTELNKRQNELTAELNAMGSEPDPDATMSPRKAAGIIKAQLEPMNVYSESDCCQGKKESLCKEAARFNDADPNESDPQFKNGGSQ